MLLVTEADVERADAPPEPAEVAQWAHSVRELAERHGLVFGRIRTNPASNLLNTERLITDVGMGDATHPVAASTKCCYDAVLVRRHESRRLTAETTPSRSPITPNSSFDWPGGHIEIPR